jgi:hypothetical protein
MAIMSYLVALSDFALIFKNCHAREKKCVTARDAAISDPGTSFLGDEDQHSTASQSRLPKERLATSLRFSDKPWRPGQTQP